MTSTISREIAINSFKDLLNELENDCYEPTCIVFQLSTADVAQLNNNQICDAFKAIQQASWITNIVIPTDFFDSLKEPEMYKAIQTCLITKPSIAIWCKDNAFLKNKANTEYKALIQHLIKSKDVVDLTLHAAMDKSGECSSLFKELHGKQFENLTVSNNGIDGENFAMTGDLLSTKTTLLDLSDNPIGLGSTQENWQQFFENIHNNPTLEELNLSHCDLWRPFEFLGKKGPTFERMWLTFLAKPSHLKKLDLRDNDLDDTLLKKMLNALSGSQVQLITNDNEQESEPENIAAQAGLRLSPLA